MEFTFKKRRDWMFLLFLLGALAYSKPVEGQDVSKRPLFMEEGFVFGYGQGIDSVNLPEGKYTLFYCMAHLGIDLLRNKPEKKKTAGIFTLYFEPQVNPVFIKGKNKTNTEMEFGVNIGFQHMYPLVKEVLYSYILIGTGPHFMSAVTTRQARGFLFSDNFGAGTYLFLNPQTALNIGFRLRHLSNGDTRSPNQGVNTWNYHIGFSKVIR